MLVIYRRGIGMKVRCIDNGLRWDLLTVGKEYEGAIDTLDPKYIKLKLDDGMRENPSYRLSRFEIVNEYEMEKTFREVIADIKEGEVWENTDIEIYIEFSGIEIKSKSGFNKSTISLLPEIDGKYKLQRKQYIFQEAFKAYEDGKEIESCVTGDRYLWNGITDLIKKKTYNEFHKLKSIGINEIRGKWYINEGK